MPHRMLMAGEVFIIVKFDNNFITVLSAFGFFPVTWQDYEWSVML